MTSTLSTRPRTTVPPPNASSPAAPRRPSKLYAAVWRWHFYAGVYVVPFVLVLAITGLVMIFGNTVHTRLGPRVETSTPGTAAPLAQQAEVAAAAVQGRVKQYITPSQAGMANQFLVEREPEHVWVVSVDPVSMAVLSQIRKDRTAFYFADHVHGTLLIGDTGDRLIEIAAGLGLFLLCSGLYLWWPRRAGRWRRALSLPKRTDTGRVWWKTLHATIGIYTGVALLFFLVSGLMWTGVWGKLLVQPWGSFPAGKWDNPPMPVSAAPHAQDTLTPPPTAAAHHTHAQLNHGGGHDVPWGLEQTPLPQSDTPRADTSTGSAEHHTPPITLDSVWAWAQAHGFAGRFRIDLPQGPQGVYSVSRDSMSGDTHDATEDRTVHLDRYSGRVLADIRFHDYSLLAKAMAIGIALHTADLGVWNIVLNVSLCLAIILLCVSGVMMWWWRRPSGAFRLAPPPWPEQTPQTRWLFAALALLGLALPLTGLAIALMVTLDALVLRHVPIWRTTMK